MCVGKKGTLMQPGEIVRHAVFPWKIFMQIRIQDTDGERKCRTIDISDSEISIYIDMRDGDDAPEDFKETKAIVPSRVFIDFDKDDNVMGIEILNL